jgi:hypothetical protein
MDALDSGTINVKGWEGNIAVQGTDKDLVVLFYAGTKLNAFKSQQQGVPMFDPVDMIKVYHPGEPLNVPERPVVESDKYRFRPQWEAYKEGKDQKVEGTPLSVIFPHQPEIVKSLGAAHISTVQQLSKISDTATQNMMFGFNLREKAKAYMDIAAQGVQYHQFERERENLQQQIKELSEQVAVLKTSEKKPEPATDQTAAIATLTQLVTSLQAQMAEKPKHPGWPKGKKRKPEAEGHRKSEPEAA